jgi:hypothetical protein
MGRKTFLERLEREREVCLKSEKREKERERDIYIYFAKLCNFLDIFGPSIGPHTIRPLQPHGDERNPTTILHTILC